MKKKPLNWRMTASFIWHDFLTSTPRLMFDGTIVAFLALVVTIVSSGVYVEITSVTEILPGAAVFVAVIAFFALLHRLAGNPDHVWSHLSSWIRSRRKGVRDDR